MANNAPWKNAKRLNYVKQCTLSFTKSQITFFSAPIPTPNAHPLVALYKLETLKKKKNLVWHSHNFLLPYITLEVYFIICFTFIFNHYFLCFVVD